MGIASKNGPSQKETSIPTIHFQVRTVSFRGGVLQMIVEIKQDVILFNLLMIYILHQFEISSKTW